MSECTHDCSSCSQSDCKERGIQKEKQNKYSNVKKVIGVVSGKGGVGKSLITSLMAVLTNKKGYNTAILDADITGPSIPKVFGLTQKAISQDGVTLDPVETKNGIKVMSMNLLLPEDDSPVVWRGPVIAGAVKQFWTDVRWGEVDFMYVDMPPGTGDVPLTVFQSLPVDGIIIVTSPQDLVGMIVEKAVNMANMMNVPILGIVENMSYFECSKCGEKHYIYGKSNIEVLAQKHNIDTVCTLPINKDFAMQSDLGSIEDANAEYLTDIFSKIQALKK